MATIICNFMKIFFLLLLYNPALNYMKKIALNDRRTQQKRFKKFLSLVNESGNSSFKYLQNIYLSNDVNYQPLSIALALTKEFTQKIGNGACRVLRCGFEGTIQAFLLISHDNDVKKYILNISDGFKILDLSIKQTVTAEIIFS